MASPVFTASQRQLTLPLDEGLVASHRSLRDCVAQGVYKRGLKIIAADLEEAPGNLSVQLSDDPIRKFSVDQLERYIQVTGDKTPIFYLVAKYLGDADAARDQAMAEVLEQLQKLPSLLHAAGLEGQGSKGRR